MHPYCQGIKADERISERDFIKKDSNISVPTVANVATIKDMPGAT